MGLFDKKKKNNDDVRILSENDIQKKLYGSLYSKNVSEPQRYNPASKPAETQSRVFVEQPKPANQDFFEKPEPTAAPAAPSLDFSSSTSSSNGHETKDRISDWVQEENKAVSNLASERPAYTGTPGVVTQPQPKKASFSKALKAAQEGIGNAFGFVLGAIVGFFLLFDFRKPGVRKAGYFALAIAFILALFFGIHYLNVQREEAMTHTRSAKKVEKTTQNNNAGNARTVNKTTPPAIAKQSAKKPSASSAPASTQTATRAAAPAPAEPKPPVLGPAAPTQAAKKSYVIQVATYATQEDAKRVADSLREQGLTSFVKGLSRPSGKLYYCVFLGRYENYKEAEAALTSFKGQDAAQPFQDSFVRTLK